MAAIDPTAGPERPAAGPGSRRTVLASRRTGMSFQRTRMAADRTLMAVMRTSLSLITFGFTIYQVFRRLYEREALATLAPALNFGIALVGLGIVMLATGIVYHLWFMFGLRKTRKAMKAEGLIRAESRFPPSMTQIAALLLLLIGTAAILSMLFRVGPLH